MPDEPTTNPPPLDYRSPPTTADRWTGPASGQVLLGFLAWLATVAGTCGFAGMAKGANLTGTPAAVVLSLPVIGMLAFGVWLRVHRGWRGFLPGLLLGFGLTCLVPVGVAAVVCGAFR